MTNTDTTKCAGCGMGYQTGDYQRMWINGQQYHWVCGEISLTCVRMPTHATDSFEEQIT